MLLKLSSIYQSTDSHFLPRSVCWRKATYYALYTVPHDIVRVRKYTAARPQSKILELKWFGDSGELEFFGNSRDVDMLRWSLSSLSTLVSFTALEVKALYPPRTEEARNLIDQKHRNQSNFFTSMIFCYWLMDTGRKDGKLNSGRYWLNIIIGQSNF